MKKIVIIFISIIACLPMLSACNSGDSGNDDNGGAKSVEIDDCSLEPGGDDTSDVQSNGGFTYTLKDPDNADGIVITPRE